MSKDLKRKLSSRKFWVAVVGFVTPILTAFNFSTEVLTQVTAIIMGGGALIAYILAEGFTDGKRESVAPVIYQGLNEPPSKVEDECEEIVIPAYYEE